MCILGWIEATFLCGKGGVCHCTCCPNELDTTNGCLLQNESEGPHAVVHRSLKAR